MKTLYRNTAGSLLVIFLLSLLASCQRQTGQSNAEGDSARQTKVRVKVGEVKEVRIASPADSTIKIVGTSENNEIVDVSERPLLPEEAAKRKPGENGSTVFQIKGVTTGAARVTFTEKGAGEQGSGRVRKTYVVLVVTK